MQLNSKNRKNFKQKTKVILKHADNISKKKNRLKENLMTALAIDFTARILQALRGEVKAAVNTTEGMCPTTGIALVYYTITFDDNNWASGSKSAPAFSRWVESGFSRDTEYIAAYAAVGLETDGEGEALLMEGWTWDMHHAACEEARK